MNCDSLNSLSDRTNSLSISVSPQSACNSVSSYTSGTYYPNIDLQGQLQGQAQQAVGGLLGQAGTLGGYASSISNLQQCGPWIPARTAVGDFLKVQYAETEVRCAITKKTVPAGAPIMLIGGMVISQEAFENWLTGHLAELTVCRHGDLHTDCGGYEE